MASGPQLPKIDTTIDTSYEVPGIEFEPIPTGSTQTEQATPRSIVASSSQPMSTLGNNAPVPEIVTSGIATPSGSIAQPTPAFMRGSSPYSNISLTEKIPQSWYIGTRAQASQPAVVQEVPVETVALEQVPTNVQSNGIVTSSRPAIGNVAPAEVVTPGIQSANGEFSNFSPGFMRGSSPYMELAPGESVPTG